MDAAVNLSLPQHHHAHAHAHAHVPLPAPHHHHHHYSAVPLIHHSSSFPTTANAPSSKPHPHATQPPPATRLSLTVTVTARPHSPSSSPALAPPAAPAPPAARSSSRDTTGYAAALADACVRAGTLRRAARHARALLHLCRPERLVKEAAAVVVGGRQMDARVAALVRMLVVKGKPAGMIAEALAEFAAICDHLLPHQPPRARHAYAYAY